MIGVAHMEGWCNDCSDGQHAADVDPDVDNHGLENSFNCGMRASWTPLGVLG